jgi:hypothetical protein
LIISNFAPEMLANEIKSILCGDNFAWFYNNGVASELYTGSFQFTHTFMRDGQQTSDALGLVKPLVYLVEMHTGQKIKGINRIKANLRVPSNIPDSMEELHQDMTSGNFMTLLYYVNDSDGDTEFYADDKKTLVESITPKANSAVWFDSKLWHKSSPPVTNKQRVVINFIVEVE